MNRIAKTIINKNNFFHFKRELDNINKQLILIKKDHKKLININENSYLLNRFNEYENSHEELISKINSVLSISKIMSIHNKQEELISKVERTYNKTNNISGRTYLLETNVIIILCLVISLPFHIYAK